jgi:hypothetical protein
LIFPSRSLLPLLLYSPGGGMAGAHASAAGLVARRRFYRVVGAVAVGLAQRFPDALPHGWSRCVGWRQFDLVGAENN